jgi:hypothetical protein
LRQLINFYRGEQVNVINAYGDARNSAGSLDPSVFKGFNEITTPTKSNATPYKSTGTKPAQGPTSQYSAGGKYQGKTIKRTGWDGNTRVLLLSDGSEVRVK